MAFTTTPEFQAALRATDQRLALKAEVYRGVEKVLDLQPVDGSVDVDADNAFRRRCKVTLVDPTGVLTPRTAADALTPYGNELRLFRGLRNPEGTDTPTGSLNYEWYRTTNHTAGGDVYANSAAEMDTFFTPGPGVVYGGSGVFSAAINFTAATQFPGQPGPDYYAWQAFGFIHIPTTGTYAFGVDGDDGVDLLIDGAVVAHYYGPKGFSNDPEYDAKTGQGQFPASLHLTKGYHAFRARMQEAAGGDGLRVAWKRPTDTAFSVIPFSQFSTAPISTPSETLIPLGVFGIADVDIQDSGAGVKISVDGFDRARRVSRASFTDVYTVPAGTNYGTAIRDLINSRMSGLQFAFDPISSTTPALVFDAGDDPWKRAQEMADNIGCDLFFDVQGVCVLRRRVTSSSPAWEFTEGQGAVVLEVSNRVQDEQTYNAVVVTGEAGDTNPPVRATAFDSDPTSPTFAGDPFMATNLAAGKTVTASHTITTGGNNGALSIVTDGSTASFPYVTIYQETNNAAVPGQPAWVQIDLGSVVTIDAVRVWHFWDDGRMFDQPRTLVSEDGVTWTTVASPANYYETGDGHLRQFTPVRARYVRDQINGNLQTAAGVAMDRRYNHWTEVRVHRAGSTFGHAVRFFASQFITTTAQAQAVADALLVRSKGLTERVSVTAIPAPQLDAGDTVRIRRGRVKVDDLYVIDALSVPLNPGGTMGVTTRKRRV